MCKTQQKKEFPNSIGLEFTMDGEVLSQYGFKFYEDVLYKIVLVKKSGPDNYIVSETLQTENKEGIDPFIYIDIYGGRGKLHEHKPLKDNEMKEPEGSYGQNKESGLTFYDDHDSRELILPKIYDPERYYEINTVRKALSDIVTYPYFDTSPSSRLRNAVMATGGKRLNSDGGNLAQIINTINNKHKSLFRNLNETLKDVNENFRGFDFNILGSGMFELMLDEEGLDSSVHVAHISDGTLRFLCLMAIFFNPDRGKFVSIDEPETGLHPDMMHSITSCIKEVATNSVFLIATHHEDIVSAFDIRNIRVFEKDSHNLSIVMKFTEEDFKNWYDEFSAGKMWRKGDIGGNRW